MFNHCLIISSNWFIKQTFLCKCICFSCPCLCKFLIVIVTFCSNFNGDITKLNTNVILFHFKVNGCFVCVIGEFCWIELNCIFVGLNGVLKFLFFVCLVSFVFPILSFLCSLKLLLFLFRHWVESFFFLFSLSFKFFLFLLSFSLKLFLLSSFFLFLFCSLSLGWNVHKVDSSWNLKYFHESRIRLHQLH